MTASTLMQAKIVLITGATDGIGRETARQLAAMDARVIVHGRSADKAAQVKKDIIADTGNDKVETAMADLSVMANVLTLAEEITTRFNHLDVLINNAGVYLEKYIQTLDGFEKTFAVNHLAPFLLTNLLLPLLKASAPARVITVSSVSHGSARVDLDNLNAEKRFHGWGAYCLSKLGNLLFTFELARRLEGSGVTANALHPGTVNTKMLEKLGMRGKPVEEGAATSVFLASSPDVAGVSGKYFSQKRIANPSETALDRELQQKFWDRSAEMVNIAS